MQVAQDSGCTRVYLPALSEQRAQICVSTFSDPHPSSPPEDNHRRRPDSAVCSPRLLKDMMDVSLKDPVCHPDAQLGAGHGWPLRTER